MKVTKGLSLPDLAALVCDICLKDGIDVVLSGGACVSIYTENSYVSYDLDFVLRASVARKTIEATMSKLGFRKDGMATRVIVLDRTGPTQYRYALWAVVPGARQTFFANGEAAAVWKGAAQQDNDDLKAGRIVEKVDVMTRAPGATLAQVQADLQVAWQAYQDEVTNSNPWVRYGTVWDGTTWTNGGVS